ncbi:MAG: hypothetical protein WC548_01195 [Candidatus Pacearchaeota archaeon]
MEIDSKLFVKIMKSNFGFKVVNTPLGSGIKMDSKSAFIFSIITGAGYLDNPLYPFTPKGLMKIFYNALDYKFVTGIFDNTALKNTPYILSKAKKYLFSGDKIVIPVEFKSELELQEKLKNFILKLNEPPTNYIIQRIEKSKKGNGMEPFMEYLACQKIKDFGFIVENQIPLRPTVGSPDFGGYCISNFLINKINLIELSLIRCGFEVGILNENFKNFFVVGEAKTSTTSMEKQIKKYLKTGFFNKAYEIHPHKKTSQLDYVGLITLNKEGILEVIESKKNIYSNVSSQKEYQKWLLNYFKYYLIANLTNDEFDSFYFSKMKKKIASINDIISFINNLNYLDIIKEIDKVITNGSVK